MAKFILTKKALDDLSDIWDYTYNTWSEQQADTYYENIIQVCELLAANPLIGKSYQIISDELMGFPCGKHLVFYQISTPDEILIIRILHQSMDLKNRIIED